MGKVKSYLYGFTIGGLIGGITVLLNTPKSGQDMREDLSTKLEQAKKPINDLKLSTFDLKDSVKDLSEKGVPIVKSALTDVQELISVWQSDIQPHIKKIKNGIQELEKQIDKS